jgi:hypothetical protein
LCGGPNGKDCGASVVTDEHGLFEINPAPLGEKWLRISASGFNTYEISIYLPSDFIGNLAVLLKRRGNKTSSGLPKAETMTTKEPGSENYVSKH